MEAGKNRSTNIRLPGTSRRDFPIPFHEMIEHDFMTSEGPPAPPSIGAPIDGVFRRRRITAVGPVQHAILEIELKIDRLRKAIKDDFDVSANWRPSAPFGISMLARKDTAQVLHCLAPFCVQIDVPGLKLRSVFRIAFSDRCETRNPSASPGRPMLLASAGTLLGVTTSRNHLPSALL